MKKIILWALFGMFSNVNHTASVVGGYFPVDPEGVAYFYVEDIGAELVNLRLNPKTKVLYLNSNGGDMIASIAIAEQVYDMKLKVVVPDYGYCISGCTIIFQAGAEKVADRSTFGYHSPVYGKDRRKVDDVIIKSRMLLTEYYEKYGLNDSFIRGFINDPELQYYSGYELALSNWKGE